ncbi:cysteine hydrolase family protein [Allobranchiibius sp. CTAmp26]|uniref:cysteine hydrolase family protein n=1 Tax=Allobranchiibius sp. CTAmp26 TaxID=2815214 RepID=UPI001AA0F1F9|nr:cysteine hydrolase [Allobranchiibius sp. CTAmp26]MBO1755389.1 cysteine hydrolase [Allobranchiibius sp. CTAmp26]
MPSDVLVVIDAQHVFADVEGPWGSPMFADVLPAIEAAVREYADRVVFTRYVAPDDPAGAWTAYFARWPFALTAPDHPQYRLVPQFAGRPTVDATTFGKWGDPLRAALGDARSVQLCGVSTDCCVLSTALPMADAGIAVTVRAQACAGSSPEAHENALAAMELYAPLITVAR